MERLLRKEAGIRGSLQKRPEEAWVEPFILETVERLVDGIRHHRRQQAMFPDQRLCGFACQQRFEDLPLKVPKRIARTVLNSLKGGVVPRIGLPYVTVGRKSETEDRFPARPVPVPN